jgi:hypothetical protein
MLIAFLAGGSMLLGDTLQALYVIFLDRGRSTLAGCFDGLSDITQVVSIGGGASTVFHHPIGALTVLTMALILIGSIAGARVGDWLSKRFTGKPSIVQSAIGA